MYNGYCKQDTEQVQLKMWKIFLKNVKLLKTKILSTAEKYENTEITYDRKEINSDDTEKDENFIGEFWNWHKFKEKTPLIVREWMFCEHPIGSSTRGFQIATDSTARTLRNLAAL